MLWVQVLLKAILFFFPLLYFPFFQQNHLTPIVDLLLSHKQRTQHKYIDRQTYPQLEKTEARNYFYASSRASHLKPPKEVEVEVKASWKQIDRNQVLSIHCNKTKHLMTSTYSGMMRRFPFLFPSHSFMLPNLHSKEEGCVVLHCAILFPLGWFC